MSTNVIVIHIGQAGVQIGNSLWEVLCIEHGVTPDGDCLSEVKNNYIRTFFQEVNNGKYIPRVIFLDSEQTVIDEIRTGVYKGLYHPTQLISGKEDAGNNFARGNFFSGFHNMKPFLSVLKKLMEDVDHVESILIFNSLGGGSGSGIGALISEKIYTDYPKICKFQMAIYPSSTMSTAIVEPYNAVFHGHSTMDNSELSMMIDNEALYDICQNLLFITSPTYSHLNRLLSMMVSSITSSMRFQSSIYTGLEEIYVNLIPYPRIHFPMLAHAPIEPKLRNLYTNFTIEQITKEVFSKSHQTLKCETSRGKYLAVMLNYQGAVTLNDVSKIVSKYKSAACKFVEWCPTGFKMCVDQHCPTVIPDLEMAFSDKSVTMMYNTTSVKDIWLKILRKFDMLISKGAYVHWYINEGMEKDEFGYSMLDIQLLTEDYSEIGLSEQEIVEMLDKEPSRRSRTMSVRNSACGEIKRKKSSVYEYST